MSEKAELSFQFDPVNHIYTVNGVKLPSVTEVLVAEGYVSSFNSTENDRIRGRYVHRICELYDNNDLDMDSVDPLLMPRLTAWQDAKKALGIVEKFGAIELKMFSRKWGFAGTLDRIYHDLLIDLKSGVKQPGFALQTGGYKILAEEDGCKILQRACVYLGDDGRFSVEWHKEKSDEFIFLCALKGYNWKRLKGVANGKHAVAGD